MKEHWKITLDLLNKYNKTRKLRAFLLKASPYKIESGKLYITFPKGSTFHKEHAEKEINLLERALKKVTGQLVKVKCIYEGEAISETSKSPTKSKSQKKSLNKEDIKNDPTVKRILQVFDGKIIEVEEE